MAGGRAGIIFRFRSELHQLLGRWQFLGYCKSYNRFFTSRSDASERGAAVVDAGADLHAQTNPNSHGEPQRQAQSNPVGYRDAHIEKDAHTHRHLDGDA
jgi:hypothetical protein